MQRANDNSNQTIEQMRQTVQTLALRVNQLERMLDNKEIREAKVDNGTVYQRGTRLSLGNGMITPGWNATDVTGSGTTGTGGMDYDHIYIGGIEYTPGANPNDYDFLQVGADGSSSWIPAMISPMPTGSEIYNVRKNHIHITGATAGNI